MSWVVNEAAVRVMERDCLDALRELPDDPWTQLSPTPRMVLPTSRCPR